MNNKDANGARTRDRQYKGLDLYFPGKAAIQMPDYRRLVPFFNDIEILHENVGALLT